MDFSSSKGLATELVRMRLITKDQANACLRRLKGKNRTGSELLDVLLETSTLTPFQAESIKRLDTDILVLGGNKLLYPNAAGSFARVFRAENLDTGETVAVKLLRHRWNNDPETIDLFQREAELGQKLNHPNIVPIYDIGAESGHHFFVMEFIEGGNLKDFVQIRKQIEPLEAVKYTIDIARGLEYALTLGVTHRDLKMTNVVFTVDGTARLIDFGLATDDDLLEKVGEGGVQTALEYSTLEKGTGAPRNDPRSDLFFLGTILYEMLLGQPPYPRTKSREERKQLTRYRNIRPLNEALPNCPHDVSFIVDRMLTINPNERYQSPTELLKDLNAAKARLMQDASRKPSAADRTGAAANGNKELSLLCVERRTREQDILRDYFTRHGFRVLMISDPDRALGRLVTNPPDLFLCMATVQGEDELPDVYQELINVAASRHIPAVIMVPDSEITHQVPPGSEKTLQVLQQPMALRMMRNHLNEVARGAGLTAPAEVKASSAS
ncbi:serine/threonine-protein kinase [Rubinisphaera margarita]|uniref:serine/threonine-protein kinase n=1 Tax=Rubinisphaera margarita TaxID=2909586 RepID=UPI001EE960B1|nr:serine/threonine-protein kinase [Rubinisphaera margarita]MCG6157302.1 protein kinase [Rubinisphaera margarita]